jgi:hypothetical protein
VIDTATDTVSAPIPTSGGSNERLAVTPDDSNVYVAKNRGDWLSDSCRYRADCFRQIYSAGPAVRRRAWVSELPRHKCLGACERVWNSRRRDHSLEVLQRAKTSGCHSGILLTIAVCGFEHTPEREQFSDHRILWTADVALGSMD